MATNAILELRGAPTALVTTRGFRDVLEMRRVRVPRLYEPLWTEAERMELQQRLAARGYDVGEIDGRIGTATLAAIRDYQTSRGLPVDGYPSQDLLARLRTGA